MKLKNGAEILHDYTTPNYRLVMVKWTGAHPYVTWRVYDDGNCYWWHYFDNERSAHIDLYERARALDNQFPTHTR